MIWGGVGGYMPPRPSVGQSQAPLTSPCPPSNHTIWFGHATHFNSAEEDDPPNFRSWLLFATSLLSILDPNTNSDPSLGLELGLGLGLG